MPVSMADKLANYGAWTYRGAWALEVAASLLGLATGIVLGFQAFSAAGSTASGSNVGSPGSMDLVLASAPFFIVALAELTKIPAATLLFSAGWKWKPIVLVFMIALAGITFETVFMGLERAATLRQLPYENLREKIDAARLRLDELKRSNDTAGSSDPVGDAQKTLSDLTERSKADRTSISDEIDQLDKQLTSSVSLSPAAQRAKDALAAKKEERDSLVLAQNKEMGDAMQSFESQRDSFVKRIEIYTQAGDLEEARKTQDQLDKLPSPRSTLAKKHQATLQPILDAITQLEADFNKELAASQPMTDSDRASLSKRRQDLVARLDRVTADWNKQIDDARQRLANAQAAQVSMDATTDENLKQQASLDQQITQWEAERIPMARVDQIRRIAGRFFGAKPEDVTEEQADLVSVIWFASLAALAALAGPVTATIALPLQRIAQTYGMPATRRGLLESWRRLGVAWHWRRVRTVKVPVEVKVEVEKEVEKRVEVPVETVSKEIVYVPVLTDDPDMVLSAMRANLPPEVTAAVQTAVKRPRRASKAQHVTP